MEGMSVAVAVSGSAGRGYCSSWAEGAHSEQEDALQEWPEAAEPANMGSEVAFGFRGGHQDEHRTSHLMGPNP